MFKHLIFCAFAGLAACSAPLERLAMAPTQSSLELRPLVSSVMVREVTLPTYAAVEEIAFEGPNGLISSNDDVLWADDPARSITIAIIRDLSDILNTDVGPDPWPFVELPDVAVDVQIGRVLARADGTFQLTGQFFVGGDGIDFRNSANAFDISTPMPDQSLSSIANAQAAAVLELTEAIAKTLGR